MSSFEKLEQVFRPATSFFLMQYQYMKSNVGYKKIIRETLTDPGLIILYKVTAHHLFLLRFEWNILYHPEFQIKIKTTFD